MGIESLIRQGDVACAHFDEEGECWAFASLRVQAAVLTPP